jgi:hypothetical protein
MKYYVPLGTKTLILALGLGLLASAGCGGGPPPVIAPRIASDAPKKAIEAYDTDKNGYLDAQELEKSPSLRAAFPKSGKVTEQDIAALLASWKDQKLGRLKFAVQVKHNHRPLADATVTLVPESFLGGEVPTATGTTDRTGGAIPTVPAAAADHIVGVPPGFYRVEITKAGANIPAKYNTATILGGTVPDVNETGWDFDLEY